MADGNITKHALANALKELMTEMPFDKITITHICERCEMNRKSFYYHFRDKYDLVNWIFDTEIIFLVQNLQTEDRFELINQFCIYLYENRTFYQAALQIEGQNSFSDHFREFLQPFLRERMNQVLILHSQQKPQAYSINFYVDILSDLFLICMERWLQQKNCMPPESFISMMHSVTTASASALIQELSEKEKS